MPETITYAGYGNLNDAQYRRRFVELLLENTEVSLSAFNRFYIDGKRVRHPKSVENIPLFSDLEFARVPKGYSGTVLGSLEVLTMTSKHASLTLSETHPAYDPCSLVDVMNCPEIKYGIGFHMPSEYHPSLFAYGIPFASDDWRTHIYFERPASTIAWSKTMQCPEQILAGSMRSVFEENLLNAKQAERVSSGRCGEALRQHRIDVTPVNGSDAMFSLVIPLHCLAEIRAAFGSDVG